MQSCGYGTCRYKTNKPVQLQEHRIERGHTNGGSPKKKEFRGHQAHQRKKKSKK